ncbi:MAG: DUF1572 domain-containing protein [Cyclobacteriaceae bacterium]|nr:DUF1572 domain-containing protein [Cyclobacteriaceae bacterium]
MIAEFLESTLKQFQYYKLLGDRTFVQLSEEEILWQPGEESNSIAIIANHMVGNMLSRWTDFLTADGEKEWRNRDMEFESVIKNKAQLLARWEQGWDCLFQALDTVNEDNFDTIVYIRNQGHSILEAINRQLAHYSYHVGQIILLGKIIKGDQWQSLSIPKGQSEQYNHSKFSQPKSKKHFTDEFLSNRPQSE